MEGWGGEWRVSQSRSLARLGCGRFSRTALNSGLTLVIDLGDNDGTMITPHVFLLAARAEHPQKARSYTALSTCAKLSMDRQPSQAGNPGYLESKGRRHPRKLPAIWKIAQFPGNHT